MKPHSFGQGEVLDDFDPRGWIISEERDDEVAYISLSSRVDCHVALDRIDYLAARQWLWCHTFGSGVRTAFGQKSPDKIYARRTLRGGTIWLHRFVTERAYGPPPSPYHVSDHLDGNSLNCRRENLRWATLSQNAQNKFGSAWLQHRFNFESIDYDPSE